MLLTLSKPAKSEFEYKTHEYSPTFSSSSSARFSPKFNGGPVSSLHASASSTMGTPHRGLPPPSGMSIGPDPGRGQPPMGPTLGSLPPPPRQWDGAEEGMRNWLMAKSEEEKRKQEEEKTRQESLRLEQRKIEHAMLRDSMERGIPPHLVPMIFAGIGGGSSVTTVELMQQYATQLQQQQHQAQTLQHTQIPHQAHMQQQGGPQPQQSPGFPVEQPRVTHVNVMIPSEGLTFEGISQTAPVSGPRTPFPGHQQFPAAPHPAGHPSSMHPTAFAPHSVPQPPPPPPPAPQSQLPRLTTNEIHIQQPPTAPPSVHQSQHSQHAQQEQSSPNIYFHHWVPPSYQDKPSSGNPLAPPSGKLRPSPSSRQHAPSQASDPDFTSSPRKRKAEGGHAPPPPPTSAPQPHTSPSYSQMSSSSTSTPRRGQGHGRGASDASARGKDNRGGSSSRRGTVSGHHPEPGHISEQRSSYSHPQRVAESQYPPQPPYTPQYEQSHAAPLYRDDGRGDTQQARAPSPMAIPPETRQSGPHQHGGSRSRPPSPERETGRK